MKILYKTILKYLLFVAFLCTQGIFAQVYNVAWNYSAPNTVGITGVYNTGMVAEADAGITVPGLDMTFYTGTDMDLTLANTFFQTIGSWSNSPSEDLIFTFPEQVVVTRFEVQNIDQSPTYLGGYDDSFTIVGAGFASATASAAVTTATVNAATSPGTVVWNCSRPLRQFKLHYGTVSGHTHAWLFYAVQVVPVPEIGPFCLNSSPGTLPATIGSNTGTWNPSTIDTSVAGTTSYTFTPNTGQALTCSINLDIVVLPNTVTLVSTANDLDNSMPDNVKHIGASNWIKATNKVGFGDNLLNNGVVYHAVNFIELNPGFESVYSSQFSAYIAPCASAYVYKGFVDGDATAKETQNLLGDAVDAIVLYPNPASDWITIAYGSNLKSIVIYSMEGKTVLSRGLQSNNEKIDVSEFTRGIYVVVVEAQDGKILKSKFVKS
jgi:hypothetical protein